MGVDQEGKILFIESEPEYDNGAYDGYDIVDYTGKMILPGFIDTHTHASQYPHVGM